MDDPSDWAHEELSEPGNILDPLARVVTVSMNPCAGPRSTLGQGPSIVHEL